MERAHEIRNFHARVMQRLLKRSMMSEQSCWFTNINQRIADLVAVTVVVA